MKNNKLILNCIFFDILYYINFKLPLLLLKIRIYYSLFIFIFIFLNGTFKFVLSISLDDLIINISDFLILSSNFESDDFNNQISSNMSSSTNQSGPTPPNLPNPISNDSSTALVQSINQDNNSNINNNNPHINGNTNINGINGVNGHTNSNVEIQENDDIIRFNDVEYDPQEDDLTYNHFVLYPLYNSFFEIMVINHIADNSILDVIEAINNTNNQNWNDNLKLLAIEFIEQAIILHDQNQHH